MLNKAIDSKTAAIIAMGILVVGGGVWWLTSRPSKPPPLTPEQQIVRMVCMNGRCGASFKFSPEERAGVPKNESGRMQCPKCKQYTLAFSRGGDEEGEP